MQHNADKQKSMEFLILLILKLSSHLEILKNKTLQPQLCKDLGNFNEPWTPPVLQSPVPCIAMLFYLATFTGAWVSFRKMNGNFSH